MRVLVFGGTGMVGHGVVSACLADDRVTHVLAVGRRRVTADSPKLRNLTVPDVADLSAVTGELEGFDACFDALGVSSLGMGEAAYRRQTKDLTAHIADAVQSAGSPDLTFVYVSGAGTDSSERGRLMWARVKGETENDLLARDFRAAMFRPGIVQPVDGARSRTGWLDAVHRAGRPAFGLARRLAPQHVLTTSEIGLAMVNLAAGLVPDHLVGERVFESRAIAELSGR